MLKVYTSDTYLAEKAYAFHILIKELLGIDFIILTSNREDLHLIALPNGAEIQFKNRFQDLSLHKHTVKECTGIPMQSGLEPAPDLFAATFFLLTCGEEAATTQRDIHGRFPAESSLAAQHGFLSRPLVNEWADWLWETLVRLGWQGQRKQRKFQWSISCDVDHPRLWWSTADRVRTLAGAILRRGDLKEAGYWLQNHVFKQKDPYDVFDEWLDLFEVHKIVAQFNFMGERPRSSDCWYPLRHPFIARLMKKLADRGHKIGFHPSYEAFDHPDLFEQELDSLRKISPLEITSGRQHYLRFSAPKTWQMWESAGLKEDSTLGYPEMEGFRCGICHDYPVFDTDQRKMLSLREKPLLAMDVTLAHYRHYSPEEAIDKLRQLRQTVEKHGGDFTLLWHNSSWNTPFWEVWKGVFQEIIVR